MGTSRRDFLRNGMCTLGGLALASRIQDFGLVHALTPQSATDYKALVCIFLNGGNDGNNMIVPLDAEYTNYFNERNPAGLAIPQASLLPINPLSGRTFGLHPNMPEMRDLFNQGKMAVLCNNGPLVEPLTRVTYQNGTGKKPLQLFSHSDQVGLFQTSIADQTSQTGWGGRVADKTAVLNGVATFPQNISIAGINLILTGVNTRQLAVGDVGNTASPTSLSSLLPLTMTGSSSEVSSRRAAFDALRGMDLNLTLVKATSDTRTGTLQTSAALASANATLTTPFPNTQLGRQLMQIARLIKVSTDPTAVINMKRQIFFASRGGFDTHNNQRGGGQDTLLLEVSQAMKAFYDATGELGLQDKVTTFTMSDFGRTFQPAGAGAAVGSDHAWGNHSLIVGGAVRGGTFYGTFPILARGGPDDTDGGSNPRGRWIPTTSVEQYAATLAAWYGLSPTDVPLVFPLIGRFSTPNLGFMS